MHDIPDTPEQRKLIKDHNDLVRKKHPNLVEIEKPGEEILSKSIKLITSGKPSQEHASEMCEEVKSVVYRFSDKVSLATAVGVLELAKLEIISEHD
jgi:hypothetical protein